MGVDSLQKQLVGRRGVDVQRCPLCDARVEEQTARCPDCGADVALSPKEARAGLISRAVGEQEAQGFHTDARREVVYVPVGLASFVFVAGVIVLALLLNWHGGT
jgi:hypothetical protein